jgi:DNA-binding MarR family transcriptional regulator
MKSIKASIALIATARGMANNFLKEELARAGLPELAPTHGNIIFALLKSGEMTMSDLAAAIRRDKSTVTALVKKLELLGYLRRRQAREDSRTINVTLTEKGERLRATFTDISERLYRIGFAGIAADDIKRMEETLEKVIANFAKTR